MHLPTVFPNILCITCQAIAPALSAHAFSLRNYTTTPPSNPNNPNSPSRPPLISRYQTTPIELFRVGPGKNILLRDYAVQRAQYGRSSIDVHIAPDGLVYPKTGPNFEWPNGASVRPLGPMLQRIVRSSRVKDTVIYRLPEGACTG